MVTSRPTPNTISRIKNVALPSGEGVLAERSSCAVRIAEGAACLLGVSLGEISALRLCEIVDVVGVNEGRAGGIASAAVVMPLASIAARDFVISSKQDHIAESTMVPQRLSRSVSHTR